MFFSAPIRATHTNTLFPANSFLMPPNFAVIPISGWHFLFPHGLAGRRFSGEGACKSHPPFNLHTFRPLPITPFSPTLEAVTRSLRTGLETVFSKSPQTGQKRCQAVCYPLFPNEKHKTPHKCS